MPAVWWGYGIVGRTGREHRSDEFGLPAEEIKIIIQVHPNWHTNHHSATPNHVQTEGGG